MSIEFNDVTHVYSPGTPFETMALSKVSLAVGEGVFLGIVGRTGSGKSTLIQLMNGLITPSAGRVTVDGTDLTARGVDLKAIRSKVGLVFQYPEHQLFEESVWEDVAFGPRCLGVEDSEIHARVEESCQAVGIPIGLYGKRSPFELSGGEMRRAAIAGVLAMKPNYLIMDEPTAGLDPRGRTEMLSLLRKLHLSGITIVMVSHSMEEVASIADRVIVMDSGRITTEGTPRQLFNLVGLLADSGLEPPTAVRLLVKLERAGLAVVPGPVTAEDASQEIYRAIAEGNRTGA